MPWLVAAAGVHWPQVRWSTGAGHQTRGADCARQDGYRTPARVGGRPKRCHGGATLEAWLDHIEPHRKPSTIDRYRRKVNGRIAPALGHVRIDRLTPTRLDDQYRAWRDEGLSPSTVRLCHAHLSAALNQAVKWGWLERNPAQRASAPAQARSQAHSITPDDLQRLIAGADADDALLATAVALAGLIGCRRSELCALRWSDVDLATGRLHESRAYTPVNGQHIETDTKTHQARSIALDAVA